MKTALLTAALCAYAELVAPTAAVELDGYIVLEGKSLRNAPPNFPGSVSPGSLPSEMGQPYFSFPSEVSNVTMDALMALCEADSRCFSIGDTPTALLPPALPWNTTDPDSRNCDANRTYVGHCTNYYNCHWKPNCDCTSYCSYNGNCCSRPTLHGMPMPNATVSTYISTTSCGSAHQGFGFVNGSCGSPDVQFMKCKGTEFLTNLLFEFDHVSLESCKGICDGDGKCTSFVYNATSQHCETYAWNSNEHGTSYGYLKMSSLTSRRFPVTVPRSEINRKQEPAAAGPALQDDINATDFAGYNHLDGKQFYLPTQGTLAYINAMDGSPMPGDRAKVIMSLCDSDDNCGAFGDALFKTPSANATIDTYFSTKTCGNGNFPTLVNGFCGRSDVQYMQCPETSFKLAHLDTYALPPALCATTCNSNAKCTVFVATKDQQFCELYQWAADNEPGYLKMKAL